MPEKVFETYPGGVEPGKSTQLSMQMPARGKLLDFFPDKGLKLLRVIAGKERISPDGEGKFTYDVMVDKGVWIVAVVTNETDAPIIGRGQWRIEGDSLPDPQKTAQPASGIIPRKPSAPPAKAGVVKAGPPKGPVKPGRNEVVVYLSHGEVRRLADAISGGMPIQNFEAPSLLRRINQALGTEPLDEPSSEAAEELQEKVSTLENKIAELEAQNILLSNKPMVLDNEGARAMITSCRRTLEEAIAKLDELLKEESCTSV